LKAVTIPMERSHLAVINDFPNIGSLLSRAVIFALLGAIALLIIQACYR